MVNPRLFSARRLSEELSQVRDEQSYIVVRERVHRNTAESTNGRVKWWSIFQLSVLIGEGIFQVWWLKRFFEVRESFMILQPVTVIRIVTDMAELYRSSVLFKYIAMKRMIHTFGFFG